MNSQWFSLQHGGSRKLQADLNCGLSTAEAEKAEHLWCHH